VNKYDNKELVNIWCDTEQSLNCSKPCNYFCSSTI